MGSNTIEDVLQFFLEFAEKIEDEIPAIDPASDDPNPHRMKRHINALKKKIINHPKFLA
jgi:hypothetical protein